MNKPMTKIFDIETGKEIEREMTAEEIENLENVQAQALAEREAKNAAIAAQASAISKLEAIGLTAEEIAALRG